MHDDEYITLATAAEGFYKEKGSKFLAFAFPVSNAEDVREILDSYRKKYHDARHHCFAYRLGPDPEVFRYNDDGEPTGTAGKPIYGQIISSGLTNVLIIVIRYFGGIKLGTGGLIRAYRAAAKDAIEHGTTVMRLVTRKVCLTFPYERLNDIMRMIKEENLKVHSQDFHNRCKIVLEIRRSQTGQLAGRASQFDDVEIS